MKEKDILYHINYIEGHYPVKEWNIDGIDVWPIIRLYIGDSLLFSGIDQRDGKFLKYNSWQRIILRCCIFFNILKYFFLVYLFDGKHNDKVHSADVLVVSDNVTRFIYDYDRLGWYDCICGPIEDALAASGYSLLKFESLNIGYGVKIPRDKKTVIINFLKLQYSIKNSFATLFGKRHTIRLDKYDEVNKYYSSICPSRTLMSQNSLVYSISWIKSFSDHIKKIMVKTKARAVIVADWRTSIAMAFAHACNQMNIPCIEIQHGYYGNECYTHYGWGKSYSLKPNYYWCWTEGSASHMNNELKIGKAFCGFHPMLRYWQDTSIKSVNVYIKKCNQIFKSDKPKILVTLADVVPRDSYPKWLEDAIKETSDKYFWMLRKHADIKKSGQDEICDNLNSNPSVEWKNSSKFPLMLLMKNAQVHVTLNSSAVIEAYLTNTPSIVLDENFQSRFKEIYDIGAAKYVNNKKDFIKSLDEYCNRKTFDVIETTIDDPVQSLISIIEQNQVLK